MPVIQWFPGHMAKARRMLQESSGLVDVILEIVDARCPRASSNDDLMKLVAHKARIKILNKADLAAPVVSRAWVEHFRRHGELAVALDAVQGTGAKEVVAAIRAAFAPRLADWVAKGRKPRAARVMAVGMPNVGKSSAINRLAGARRTKVEDRPGVTRGLQWVRIGSDVELLDMPGVLVPKFEDPYEGVLLAAVRCIKEDVFDQREVAGVLLTGLWAKAPEAVQARFGLTVLGESVQENLEAIGRARGLLQIGGTVDDDKVARLILKEFREGRLGRISLEEPGAVSETPRG